MDNKIFNVNGRSQEMLRRTLNLLFENQGFDTDGGKQPFKPRTVDGWYVDRNKGIVLVWLCDNLKHQQLPVPLSADAITPIIWAWLHSEDAKKINLEEWDSDIDDTDVSTDLGWRVYLEDWGRIGSDDYSICAIKPCYLWYGK